jgi:Flp pilus assembly protein CpaB
MRAKRLYTVWIVALVGLALASTLQMRMSAARHHEIIQRKADNVARIETLAGRWGLEDDYRAQLEAQGAWQPADLDALAVQMLGEGTARLAPRPATPAADGWQRREVAVEIQSVAYAQAIQFLAAAAETLPAWRLREIDLRPSADSGQGSMTAVLEALEKKRP